MSSSSSGGMLSFSIGCEDFDLVGFPDDSSPRSSARQVVITA